jgi:hypothetical protein
MISPLLATVRGFESDLRTLDRDIAAAKGRLEQMEARKSALKTDREKVYALLSVEDKKALEPKKAPAKPAAKPAAPASE